MSAPAASAALARRDRFVEAEHGARVGARDDDEVGIVPRGDGGADLGEKLVERNDRLVVEVAALLREALVLDVQAGDAAPLVFAHRTGRIELVAVAGIGIGDDRHIDGGGDPAGIVRHLRHGDEPVVGIAERRRGAGAGHVDGIEAGLRDGARGDAVIGAGRDRVGRRAAAVPGIACHESWRSPCASCSHERNGSLLPAQSPEWIGRH